MKSSDLAKLRARLLKVDLEVRTAAFAIAGNPEASEALLKASEQIALALKAIQKGGGR